MKSAKVRKQIVFAVWFVCFISALEFFRFKFGLFRIGFAFMIVGIPVMWFFSHPKKTLAGSKSPPGPI
jgi:hypothetical protein